MIIIPTIPRPALRRWIVFDRSALGEWLSARRQLWVRVLLVSTAIFLSAVLARNPSLTPLLALAAACLLIAVWRSPVLGLILLLASAVLVPFGIGTGTESPVNAAVVMLVVLGALWLFGMILRHEVRLLPSRPIVPLLAMALSALISFVVGSQLWLPLAALAPLRAQIGGLAIYLLSLLAFLLVAHQLPDLRYLRRFTWTFVAIGALCTLDQSGLLNNNELRRAYSIVGAESIFWVWLISLAFGQALLNRTLALPWRLGLGVLVVVYLVYALTRNRNWNSGWVPIVVAMFVILWSARPRIALAVSVFACAALVVKFSDLAPLLINDKNDWDLLTRTAAWEILWKIAAADPLLGTGFANYYFYTPLYPILGWVVKFNSHNNYMDMIVQTGFVGLAVFLWFFWEVTHLAWRLRTRVPEGFPSAYVHTALGAIAATLVAAYMGDWVLPFVYNIGLNGFRGAVIGWLFLGGLVVLERLYLGQLSPKLE